MTTTEQQPGDLDQAKLNAFIGKAAGDWGTLTSAALVVIGDKLGLYTALAEFGPATPGELAQRTGTVERYVRPWLINQAAGGYLDYNANTCRYYLPPEHAAALGAVAGAYYMFTAAIKAEPRITAAFKTGQGMLWSEHDAALFAGTERFFRPGYEQNLVPTAGLAERVTFEVAGADAYPAPLGRYDLVAFFDPLHDMGDPVGAIRHAASTLTEDGTVLLVEPMAGEQVEDNLNPVGRVYAAASVLICTPHAVAEGGTALGTIATEAALREVVKAGGLSRFRRATETPFNRVFEARR